jgi:hypothetical protein
MKTGTCFKPLVATRMPHCDILQSVRTTWWTREILRPDDANLRTLGYWNCRVGSFWVKSVEHLLFTARHFVNCKLTCFLYGCEIWVLTRKTGTGVKLIECKVQWKIFKKGREGNEKWGHLQNEVEWLRNLYLMSVVFVMKEVRRCA